MSKSIPATKVYSAVYGTALQAKVMRDWVRDCPFVYSNTSGLEGHDHGYRAYIVVETERDRDIVVSAFASDKGF